jgi:hypothetical protein
MRNEIHRPHTPAGLQFNLLNEVTCSQCQKYIDTLEADQYDN